MAEEEEEYMLVNCHLFLQVQHRELETLHLYSRAALWGLCTGIAAKRIPLCRGRKGESGIHFWETAT